MTPRFFGSCKGSLRTTQRFSEHSFLLFWLFIFSYHVNHSSSKKSKSSSSRYPLAAYSWNHLHRLLASQSKPKSSCTAPILHGRRFWSFVALWPWGFRQPSSNRDKGFLLACINPSANSTKFLFRQDRTFSSCRRKFLPYCVHCYMRHYNPWR